MAGYELTISDAGAELNVESAQCFTDTCTLEQFFDPSPTPDMRTLRDQVLSGFPAAEVAEIDAEVRRLLAARS